MIALWFALALGQDAPAAPIDPRINEEGLLEVIVVGEQDIKEAREAVVRDMEELGYRSKTRGDGTLVFKPPKSWMGRVRLSREGLVEFGRPVLALAGGSTAPVDQDPLSRDPQSGITPQLSLYVLPSKRKLSHVEVRVLDEVWPEIREYNDAIARKAFGETLYALPAHLDATWAEGTPLLGDTPLPTPAARKAAILDYWSGLPDSAQGNEASRTVETWLRAMLQGTPDAVTLEEQRAAEGRRPDGRRLGLVADPEPEPDPEGLAVPAVPAPE